jgi:hypothetical protein
MSRFDDELVKQADNAHQMRGLPDPTTPKPTTYAENQAIQPYGDSLVPAQVNVTEEAANWAANQPMRRQLQVTDLEAADPMGGQVGEIVGMPGYSNVYALGGPDPLDPKSVQGGGQKEDKMSVAASVDPIDESLYNVYKASREIRDAIDAQNDFDFKGLFTAANDASTVARFASIDDGIHQVTASLAGIVSDIESDLAETSNYHQASANLTQFETLLEEINKVAAKKGKNPFAKDEDDADDEDSDSDDDKCSCDGKGTCKHCKSKLEKKKNKKDKKHKKANNGNQETGVVVDVRDLDDQAGVFDREKEMTPDHMTNVLDAESVNGDAAGYVNYYNDGSGTGIVPQQGPHHQEVFPYDGTNPAFVPYQKAAAAVRASREKIFAALHLVDRLEKLGMVQEKDRALHLAKFEQMNDSKLAGFVASIELLEESGARQPRSQKLASGSSRLPEMGRMTTASTISRQDIQTDDWLMTL